MPIPIIGAALAVALIVFVAAGYKKATSEQALIISGIKKVPKVLIGKAGFCIPFFERCDKLDIAVHTVDIKTDGFIPTQDFIGVDIDAVAKVHLISERDRKRLKSTFNPLTNSTFTDADIDEMIAAAQRNFLNKIEEDETTFEHEHKAECRHEITVMLKDALQSNMREIIGTQELRELCTNRQKFSEEVQAKAQPDMNALGVWIDTCGIQKIEDENNLIVALGQDNMSKIKKDASIAKANADKEVAIAEAEARKLANDAKVASDLAIAEKQQTLKIKQAELKKDADIKQAEADAAYEIQKETQRKTIEQTKADADLAKQAKQIELEEKQIQITEKRLDAEIKKKADADRYKTEIDAEARKKSMELDAEAARVKAQKQAEAQAFQREKEAEAEKNARAKKAEAELIEKSKEAEGKKALAEAVKAQGLAEAAATEAKGLANAKAIEAAGLADAKAVEAKGLAEAEALNKKADAMQNLNKASDLEVKLKQIEADKEVRLAEVKALPDAVKYFGESIAHGYAAMDNVTIYDNGSGQGVDRFQNSMFNGFDRAAKTIKQMTGFDVASGLGTVLANITKAKDDVNKDAKKASKKDDSDFREVK